MHRQGRWAIACPMVLLLGACSGPMARYEAIQRPDTLPPNGGIAFALRTTTITLSSQAAGSCAKGPATEAWATCLKGLHAQPAAAQSRDTAYLMIPASGWPSQTAFSATSVTDRPLMVKSVSVRYDDGVVTTINSVGSSAAEGFGIAGVPGAVAGGIVGLFRDRTPLTAVSAAAPPLPNRGAVAPADRWTLHLCEADRERWRPEDAATQPLALRLPIAIATPAFPSPSNSAGPDATTCWHRLVNEAPADPPIVDGSGPHPVGWLYRIVPAPASATDRTDDRGLPEDAVPARDYFAIDPEHPDDRRTAKKSSFPVPACRSVRLELAWWQVLQSAYTASERPARIPRAQYPLQVADPDFVEPRPLPKAGVIALLDVCGGYTAPASATVASSGQVIDAVVQQSEALEKLGRKP